MTESVKLVTFASIFAPRFKCLSTSLHSERNGTSSRESREMAAQSRLPLDLLHLGPRTQKLPPLHTMLRLHGHSGGHVSDQSVYWCKFPVNSMATCWVNNYSASHVHIIISETVWRTVNRNMCYELQWNRYNLEPSYIVRIQ